MTTSTFFLRRVLLFSVFFVGTVSLTNAFVGTKKPTRTATCFINRDTVPVASMHTRRTTRSTTARSAVDVGNHSKDDPTSLVLGSATTDDDSQAQKQVFSVGPALQSLQTKLMYKEHPSSLSSSSSSSDAVTLDNNKLQEDDGGMTIQQKAINLLFLSAAFGYSIYTIVNIDHGMTRGWSATEIAMRVPLDNWGAYESYLANKPIVTKTLINVIIYLLGDWLSQTAFQGKNVLEFDISRTLRNGFIGLCFGPLVHQYYEFSDAILPPENGLVTRLEKILMDQTIYLTVKCSVYISAVGLLGGEDWPTVKQTVQDKIVGVVLTAWVRPPINFCVV
jgi:protein Mpv17